MKKVAGKTARMILVGHPEKFPACMRDLPLIGRWCWRGGPKVPAPFCVRPLANAKGVVGDGPLAVGVFFDFYLFRCMGMMIIGPGTVRPAGRLLRKILCPGPWSLGGVVAVAQQLTVR